MLGSNQSASFSRRSRVRVVIAVIALHLAFLSLFLAAPRSHHDLSRFPPPVELIYVRTTMVPLRQAVASDRPHVKSAAAISIALPQVEFPTLPSTESASTGQSVAEGVGAGIDWAAEARRELQAHEIRQNAPPSEDHMAGRSPEDNWWPRAGHQKGDRYKTETGDWVVWINSTCYQVATAMPRSVGQGTAMPQTYCLTQKRDGP